MKKHFNFETTYFLQEGKENLRECLAAAFNAAIAHRVGKILIFTAEGQGIRMAIDEFLVLPQFADIRIVAVTFPNGKIFTDAEGNQLVVEISAESRRIFREHNVRIVRAHLPFDPIAAPFKDRGPLAQDLSLVGSALGIFGGSMSLCVQATALACDAGAVNPGDHVIAMTSDTAILAQASPTSRILCDMVIREVICKPAVLSIGRKENADQLTMDLQEPEAAPKMIEGQTIEGKVEEK